MKIVLVETDPFFRALVRKFLERDLPDAELTEIESVDAGTEPEHLQWSQFDVLLLSHDLGESAKGLDWLTEPGRADGIPPVVYFTETGSEELAKKARMAGVAAVLKKRELSGDNVARTIDQVLRAARAGIDAQVPPEPVKPVVEGFKIASQIGKGAKSRVYLAERETDQQTVVLKIIDLDLVNEHAHVKRFVEEAELVSGLSSPYVVRVFEHGFTDDCGYMAMEFFPRGDLKHRIEIGLTHADAVHCLANIAYSLQAIHAVGIVHRDLKPANVMFRHDDTLALADFGISRRLATESELRKTGRVLGTPHYMSPEQGRGRPVDVRNDIYSLGVMFYEMLTGDKPFRAATPAGLIQEHMNTPIPLLPSRMRRYQALLEKLLAKEPDERYQSADELLAAL